MGDLSSSDCSWKKMVIAKANNKWISTMKMEHSEIDDNTVSDTEMDSIEDQICLANIKKEQEESSVAEHYEGDIQMSNEQELDPLSLLQTARRQRRKSSGGLKYESPQDRASRLAKMSAYAAHRLANETFDQRANRLKRMSEYSAKRLAHETSEQRARRLSRMSAYAAKRLANETAEQRQARLARMSAYAAKRQAMKREIGSSSAPFSDDPPQINNA